jgi:hypothetical protein
MATSNNRGSRPGGRPRQGRSQRQVRAVTRDGPKFLPVASAAEASIVGSHDNAVKVYLYTGKTTQLRPFAGIAIAGHTLETDPDGLDYWARRGDLDFDTFYKDI